MTRLASLILAFALGGCQLYAGGGTMVSDGRSTTVRASEIEASPGRVRTRAIEVGVKPDGGGY